MNNTESFTLFQRIRNNPGGDYTGKWEYLTGSQWDYLLRDHPQLSIHCDWSKLGYGDWACLIVHQPQFIECCDLSILNDTAIVYILSVYPELHHRFDMSKVDAGHWMQLLATIPKHAGLFIKYTPMAFRYVNQPTEEQTRLHTLMWEV